MWRTPICAGGALWPRDIHHWQAPSQRRISVSASSGGEINSWGQARGVDSADHRGVDSGDELVSWAWSRWSNGVMNHRGPYRSARSQTRGLCRPVCGLYRPRFAKDQWVTKVIPWTLPDKAIRRISNILQLVLGRQSPHRQGRPYKAGSTSESIGRSRWATYMSSWKLAVGKKRAV